MCNHYLFFSLILLNTDKIQALIMGSECVKKTLFIKNALILTASSLVLRFAGIIFKVWLAAVIGSEGIGLYQLIFSVYVLVSTFATSGISTAVTRLTAEELALGTKGGTLKILKRSIELTAIIAVISTVAVFLGAEFIANTLLEDSRAIPALKILPFSLIFMGISSCLRGYFIARRKVTPNAATQLLEQTIRIALVFILVKKFAASGLSACCTAVILGDIIAETAACAVLAVTYFFDSKKLNSLNGRARPPYPVISKILHISMPITSGRYLNSLLRTGENILVPKNLAKYPLSSGRALSQFGMIKGMALPILFFPSAVINAISTLLIPEISEASAKGQTAIVKTATQKILKLTALISFIFAAIFLFAGNEIGTLIYKEKDVGFLLKALSPIVPLMYLDSISDGILKGLDQQMFSFRTAISDSVIRIILILLLLPITGLFGFIVIMYFSNFLTCFLNVGRLLRVSGAAFKIGKELVTPLLFSFGTVYVVSTAISYLGINSYLIYVIAICTLSIPLYFLLLSFSGIIDMYTIKNILR